MKRTHHEDGKRGEALPMGPGADVCRDGHLGDVELEPPDHPAKRIDDDRHVFELEVEGTWPDGAVLERAGLARGGDSGLQPEIGHGRGGAAGAMARSAAIFQAPPCRTSTVVVIPLRVVAPVASNVPLTMATSA